MFNRTSAARRDRRAWSDRFVDSYRHIMAEYLGTKHWNIQVAPHEQDYYEATDLILPDGRRVACKTRRAEFYEQYPLDFALRHTLGSPYKTEFEKVKAGFGDFLLYTHCNSSETEIAHWMLIDLNVLRTAAASYFAEVKPMPHTIRDGNDLGLICFRVDAFPETYGKLVLASS